MTSISTYQPLNRTREENEEDSLLWKSNKLSEYSGGRPRGSSFLTRATSFMTWDTSDLSTKYNNNTEESQEEGYDYEAQNFSILSKKQSLQSLTGFTILPTIYGSNGSNFQSEDELSECSYVTGR